MGHVRVAILGAGPAGVAAAWQLHHHRKANAIVLEQRPDVGGNAGSFELEGLPVDYGSHRLHPSCQANILSDVRTLLGEDLLSRPRHGRIRLRGRWVHFPLRAADLLAHLPWSFGCGVARDALVKIVSGLRAEERASFASVLQGGLGKTICRDFYFPYALKIWGIPPEELSATQAQRRVSAVSLKKLLGKVVGMLPSSQPPGAGQFFYPRHGYGQISRAIAAAAQGLGADTQLRTAVRRIQLGTPHRIDVESDGIGRSIEADQIWSTIPITTFARAVSPPAPPDVLAACQQISFRAMILVYVVLTQRQFTPFDAHYFPEAEIKLTRLSEPKNYSGRTDPPDRTVLCGELPCTAGDVLWDASDDDLAEVVRDSLARCGLPIQARIVRVTTKRLAHAYPIYRRGYEEHFQRLDEWITGLDRVLSLGRQGLFAHDNTHHTLAMAYAAVDCLDSVGRFDRDRWSSYRAAFKSHVVED